MAWALLTLVLSLLPQTDGIVTQDTVDVTEVNHFFDECGRHVFDQVIYYVWQDCASRHQVRAWRLLKSPFQWPYYHAPSGEYRSVWLDGDRLRLIHSRSFRETWLQYDPELAERQILPTEDRHDLSK